MNTKIFEQACLLFLIILASGCVANQDQILGPGPGAPKIEQIKEITLPEFAIPSNETQNYIEREYTWTYKDRKYTWSAFFPKALYDYYKNKPRPPTRDYSVYATDPFDDSVIRQSVSSFRKTSQEEGFNERETINFVVTFVQSLQYTADDVTTPFDEYPRYPLETLIDNGGDCEDTSILVSTLLAELGYDSILVSPPQHLAVGVACTDCSGAYYQYQDKKYFYLETTGDGWEIGEMPTEYEGTTVKFYTIVPKPVITLEWSSEAAGSDPFSVTYEINITVNNQGSAAAENLVVWAAFDTTEEGKVYSKVEGEPQNLRPGEELNSIVTLSAPRGVYTRVHILVSGNNFFTQESVSEWVKN